MHLDIDPNIDPNIDLNKERTIKPLVGLFAAFLILAGSACISAGPADEPQIQTLGFLEDYSQLAPGRAGQARLIYISDEADFADYSAILIEPVVAWGKAGGEPTQASRDLASRLDEGLRREFARAFELVDRPGEGAMRMRSALALQADSYIVLEVEILDAASDARLIAAVDRREFDAAAASEGMATPVEEWPVTIRNRLSTFRRFDARAREREEAGENAP